MLLVGGRNTMRSVGMSVGWHQSAAATTWSWLSLRLGRTAGTRKRNGHQTQGVSSSFVVWVAWMATVRVTVGGVRVV